MANVASASYSLHWMAKEKRWLLCYRSEAQPAKWVSIETKVGMDPEVCTLIARAIEGALLGILVS